MTDRIATAAELDKIREKGHERLLEAVGIAHALADDDLDTALDVITGSRFTPTALLLSMTGLALAVAEQAPDDPHHAVNVIATIAVVNRAQDETEARR